MNRFLILMAMCSMLVAPIALAGDDDDVDDRWSCTCSATCDGVEISVTMEVCADDDALSEAVDDGVKSCDSEMDGKCEDHSICHCECKLTGLDC